MKQFRKILCLLLAMLFVLSALASCGGDETPDTTQPGGDNGNNNGGDTTTTLAPGPCETHTFAAGSLCTDTRTCTVCGTTVEAGVHVYAEGSLCTEARSCTVCGAAATVNAEHTPGAYATCGTDQTCIHCSYIFAERTNRHGYKDNICTVCGQKRPMEISEFTIAGLPIEQYTVVTPNREFYEPYISALIRHRVDVWHGVEMKHVTDKTEKKGPEIRIGKTNRTVTEVGDFEYAIKMVGEDLEIVCGNMYAFEGLIDKICEIISRSVGTVHLAADTNISETFQAKDTDALNGDVRIMYHNVLQFGTNINISSRYVMFRMLYSYYQPDVIGMQEANATFFNADNGIAIKSYLTGNGYKALSDGMAEVIYYNTKTLTVIKQEYIKTAGNYGTNWVLFQHKATGEYFGVECSHFAANSVAKDEAEANQMRIRDAKSVLEGKGKIIAAAKAAGIENPEQIPIIVGGDYNSRVGSDPIAVIEEGFVNARQVADSFDDYATCPGGPSYNSTYNYHLPHYCTLSEGSGKSAIDHVYCHAEGITYDITQYRILTNDIAAGASDHLPHYVDISFK